ncbi:MAG: hypothetical protein EPO37_00730 [Nitrosarchaeum sp.]|nr:MAG: hypothetical protein EPO37_00730 [Nitrosarchaeum sp.]
MIKKKEISILVAGAALLVLSYAYLDTSDTIFGVLTDPLTPVDWDELPPREIVKNSIPIELLEENFSSCKVSAPTFEMIINHPYFIRADELAKELQYDNEAKTLIVPCDQLIEKKSKLVVWYVIEEAKKHAAKYEYWIEKWVESTPNNP